MAKQTVNKSLAPVGLNAQARVNVKPICDLSVPKADDKIYGSCNFYYRPYGMDTIGPTEVYKIKFSRITEIATEIFNDPKKANDIFKKSIIDEEELINISDHNWSRWHDFKSRHRNCGHQPPPYYINYGYYYCSRYRAYLYPSLTGEAGRKWLIKGKELLQIYLDKALQDNMSSGKLTITSKKYPQKYNKTYNIGIKQLEISPEHFKKVAFLTHVPAYVDADLADVSVPDMIRIVCGPVAEEWLDPDTLVQAIDAAIIVAGDWIGRVIDIAIKAKNRIIKMYKDPKIATEKLLEFYKSLENTYKGAIRYGSNVADKIINATKKLGEYIPW